MTALSLHAWLNHMWPAVAIIAAILVGWGLAAIPFALITARLLRRCDHDHAADHAPMPLGTLLPGPSDTPVGDLAAKVVGL